MNALLTNTFWKSYLLTALVCLFLFPAITIAMIDYGEKRVGLQLQLPGGTAATSTMTLSIHNPHQLALNAVEAEIFFDPASTTVTDLSIISPLCEERFIIAHEVDNAVGRVFFQCGTISPLTATNTIIATIDSANHAAAPLASSTFRFGTSTHLLAHDGFGTDLTGAKTVQ